ncbi:MAG: biotin/lipoyl-containing protein [Bacteroidia bacterium]|jgi:biotin carboxyl carrier protein|nr:biotin/lipoyl-containing protein [Bacteroidia bacterium]
MTEIQVDQHTFALAVGPDGWTVDGAPVQPEITRRDAYTWDVTLNHQRYQVLVMATDPDNQTVTLRVNGKETTLHLTSRTTRMLKALGMEQTLTKKADVLKAPMPGLIHSIKVQPGDTVQKGDPVLILEAMKMENMIKATAPGVVAQIHVQEKQSVEKGERLISFE